MNIATNRRVAMKLEQAADLLGTQGANPFRVGAYRRAADTVIHLEEDLRDIVAGGGREALMALPNIGKGIAASIMEMVTTGRWAQLDRLRGSLDPARLFQSVPGIGPGLAQRIHDTLHIDTLEALENAAYNGDLALVEGMGSRRIAAIRHALAALLGRAAGQPGGSATPGPEAGTVLEVDRRYREQVRRKELPMIAPKRFNPGHEPWLPVLHSFTDGWHFTAMYSNSARAHELGHTHDWVLVYFYDDHHQEGQYTVVTETTGSLKGRRVIRGREADCRAWYRQHDERAVG